MRHSLQLRRLTLRVGINPADTRLNKSGSAGRSRRGLSLVIVMIAISMSMVLTYAALNSQARGVQVRQNVNRQEMARQAASSGASIALNSLQSASWSGAATPLSGTLSSDRLGSTTYVVTFLTIDGQETPAAYPANEGQTSINGSSSFFDANSNGLSTSSADSAATATRQAFQLLIRSTGKWQSAIDLLDFVTETIEVGVELQPRVPGRTILTPDIAQATDVLASNGGYDTIQNYALFASAGSNGSPSLTLQPGQRIDGDSWLTDGVSVFNGPKWNSSVRNEFLQSIGILHTQTSGTTTTLSHPHPFGGPVAMVSSFSTSEITDLTKLNVPRVTASGSLTPPPISFSSWKTYQLYQGGFNYSAETVSSTLDDIVLRPSLRNPLGVFYREGNLTIDDNTVVQGTLICSGKITFMGNNVLVASNNWRDSSGGMVVSSSHLFPRLPAIVASSIQLNSGTRASIEGAVLLTGTLSGADGSFDYVSSNDLNLSGTQATSAPLRQPYSQVQLPIGIDLSSVSGNGDHAIWLAEGSSGNWFPIIDVDATNRQLTILGEASRPSPTSFRILRQRVRNFDVRGPLLATRVSFTAPSSWKLSSSLWNNQHSLWQIQTQIETNNGLPITPFVTWVADPANYTGWGSPWDRAGLPLEPVIHLRPQTGVRFRDSLPLFRSYVAPSNLITASNDPSGYRWRVLFWRDMP